MQNGEPVDPVQILSMYVYEKASLVLAPNSCEPFSLISPKRIIQSAFITENQRSNKYRCLSNKYSCL